jgi:hypothetical protein
VETARELNVRLTVGAEVTCLFGDAKLRNASTVTVASEAPLFFDCSAPEAKKYSFPRTVVLVYKEGEKVLRGEAEAESSEQQPNGTTRIKISKINWENIDRRQYPRLAVSLPVKIRAVYESKEETVISVVEGHTEDLSVGGSKVWVDHPVIKGSLVEFSASLSDVDTVRALGLVVHSDPDGYLGIAFMDYLGGARTKLHEFTKEAAA